MSPDTPLSDERRRRIDAICDTFEAAWRAGQTPRIEDQLEKIEAAARPALFKELLLAEWELAEERGTAIKEEDYVARFAEFKDVIRELLEQRKPAARMPEAIAHYRILKPLGAGGMGEVFLAEDTKLDRQVALKLLPRDLASDPRRRQRFMPEAKAVSALNHPNVCIIHEVGETAEHWPYIAMRSEEHTSELQSPCNLVCRLLLEKKKK